MCFVTAAVQATETMDKKEVLVEEPRTIDSQTTSMEPRFFGAILYNAFIGKTLLFIVLPVALITLAISIGIFFKDEVTKHKDKKDKDKDCDKNDADEVAPILRTIGKAYEKYERST